MEKKRLVWDVCRIAREHRKTVEKRVCSLGIHPSQHHFLMYISEHTACTQNSIAVAMGVSAATVAVSLKKLESGGYIERKSSPGDGRSNRLELTLKGVDVVEQSKLLFDEVDQKMFETFTKEELEQLHGYMERIFTNLKTMESEENGFA